MNTSFKNIVLGVALGAGSSAALAQSPQKNVALPPVALSIEAQPLGDSLNELARQTGLQVVLYTDTGEGIRALSLKGTFTPEQAFEKLLVGTGLKYRFLDDKTVMVTSTERSTSTISETSRLRINDAALSGLGLATLAQIDSGNTSESEGAAERESPQDEKLEEVVVTAQKRVEKLQDVPISISVLSGRDLDRATGGGLLDSLKRVPGVSMVESAQGGGTQLAIRGVSAGGALVSGSSPVAYYLDSVPFAFARNAIVPDVNPYDLDRVEVLRGPQGTLYGASALNGVIRVLTHDAQLDEFDFKARLSTSSTDEGGENYRADAAINVPLIDDKLAARLVVGYQDDSGWIDRPNVKDANDSRIRNARLKLKYQPTEEFSLGLSAWHTSSERDMPSIADDNMFHRATMPEPVIIDRNVYSLDIGYKFPSVSLLSTSSYLDQELDSQIDRIVFNQPGISLATNLPITVFTQEIYFNSDLEGPWRWSFGGMYRDEEEHLYQTRTNAAGALCCSYVAPTDYITASKSFAVFGEATRSFLDGRFELTGGLRYFEDDESADEISRQTGNPALQPPGTAAASPYVHPRSKFNALTPRAVLTWHARDELTLYTSYSEGFRSGVDQLNSVLIAAPLFGPVDADTLKNYEMGVKGALFGGHLNFDGAVYFIDWLDVQQSLPVVIFGLTQAGIINSGRARGPGVDLAVNVRPLNGLQLGINASWNELEFAGDVLIAGGWLYARKGERLSLSPEYTLGGSADYLFSLGNRLSGRFSASATYTAEQLQRSVSLTADSVAAAGDSMLTAQASFSVESDEHWTVTLFAENLSNESGTATPSGVSDWSPRIRPRTVGLQFEYDF